MIRTAFKKLIFLLVAITIVMNYSLPLLAFAEGEPEQEIEEVGSEYEVKEEEEWDVSTNGDGSVKAKWTLKDRTITISGSGKMRDFGFETNMYQPYYKYRELIEKVIIGDKISDIGEFAFSEHNNLKEVEILEGVKRIKGYAFLRCYSLENIKIPNGLESIEEEAFDSCKKITEFKIPESVVRLYTSAFSSCDNLEKIVVDENNPYYSSEDGVLFNKDKTKILCHPM